jgi:hypothetical protein
LATAAADLNPWLGNTVASAPGVQATQVGNDTTSPVQVHVIGVPNLPAASGTGVKTMPSQTFVRGEDAAGMPTIFNYFLDRVLFDRIPSAVEI